MDINCGVILDRVTIEAKGREIFEEVIAVASGKKSKSEELGYGDNEFVPWQIGAVMWGGNAVQRFVKSILGTREGYAHLVFKSASVLCSV